MLPLFCSGKHSLIYKNDKATIVPDICKILALAYIANIVFLDTLSIRHISSLFSNIHLANNLKLDPEDRKQGVPYIHKIALSFSYIFRNILAYILANSFGKLSIDYKLTKQYVSNQIPNLNIGAMGQLSFNCSSLYQCTNGGPN